METAQQRGPTVRRQVRVAETEDQANTLLDEGWQLFNVVPLALIPAVSVETMARSRLAFVMGRGS
jgi:hypothetical protein